MSHERLQPPQLPEFERATVMVVGDVMLDTYVWGDVSRISPEAPVQVVKVNKKTYALGGAGNVAANLAALGCRALCVGVRGKDEDGKLLARQFEQAGIEARLVYAPLRPTTAKTRVMGRGQQLMRLDDEHTASLLPETTETLYEVFSKHLSEVSVVVVSDYDKGVFGDGLAAKIIADCREAGKPVFVDPKGAQWSRYQGAFCVTPNTKEFLQVAQFDPDDDKDLSERAATALAAFGLQHLLVTRGPLGLSLFSRSTPPLHVPTQAREVFDVSGAGDTVIATLAAAHGAGLSMDKAAVLANLAAGIAVGKLGTKPVFASELEEGLRKKREGTGHKVRTMDQALRTVSAWRAEGRSVVFTNGCFDLLHVGHIKLLHQASELGDRLVVGLNSDASVRRLKGESRPILPEAERAGLLAALECVDTVVLFAEDTPIELIKALKPDVLVKGGDYTVETVVGHDLVEQWGGRVELVPLAEGKSTSALLERLKS